MTTLQKTPLLLIIVGILGLVSFSTQAYAHNHYSHGGIIVRDDPSSVELAAVTKVTIRDAITSAEKACPGTVIDASLERENGRAVWEVKVFASDRSIVKFYIDASDGSVLRTASRR